LQKAVSDSLAASPEDLALTSMKFRLSDRATEISLLETHNKQLEATATEREKMLVEAEKRNAELTARLSELQALLMAGPNAVDVARLQTLQREVCLSLRVVQILIAIAESCAARRACACGRTHHGPAGRVAADTDRAAAHTAATKGLGGICLRTYGTFC